MTSTVQGSRGPAMNTVYKTELQPSQGSQSSREDKQHYNVMSKTGDMRLKPCAFNSRPDLRAAQPGLRKLAPAVEQSCDLP